MSNFLDKISDQIAFHSKKIEELSSLQKAVNIKNLKSQTNSIEIFIRKQIQHLDPKNTQHWFRPRGLMTNAILPTFSPKDGLRTTKFLADAFRKNAPIHTDCFIQKLIYLKIQILEKRAELLKFEPSSFRQEVKSVILDLDLLLDSLSFNFDQLWKRVEQFLSFYINSNSKELNLLGFSEIPSKQSLRQRYLELAKKHHPDLSSNDDTFIAIKEAYEKLDAM